MDKIKFGTDGWRGVIADDFTFTNVRRVAAAIAQYVREESEPARGLIVGYDMRFLSAEFARATAEVLSAAGIPVWLADAGHAHAGGKLCGGGAENCGRRHDHGQPQSFPVEWGKVQSAVWWLGRAGDYPSH